jgi:hypothetical protein
MSGIFSRSAFTPIASRNPEDIKKNSEMLSVANKQRDIAEKQLSWSEKRYQQELDRAQEVDQQFMIHWSNNPYNPYRGLSY